MVIFNFNAFRRNEMLILTILCILDGTKINIIIQYSNEIFAIDAGNLCNITFEVVAFFTLLLSNEFRMFFFLL